MYADAQDRDLGGVSDDVSKIVQQYLPTLPWWKEAIPFKPFFSDHVPGMKNFFKLPPSKVPKATTIEVRGQVESMNTAFEKLGIGIVFAVMLVYFLMVVNFQSWLDPMIIIMALPGAFSGILWMLFATHTDVLRAEPDGHDHVHRRGDLEFHSADHLRQRSAAGGRGERARRRAVGGDNPAAAGVDDGAGDDPGHDPDESSD